MCGNCQFDRRQARFLGTAYLPCSIALNRSLACCKTRSIALHAKQAAEVGPSIPSYMLPVQTFSHVLPLAHLQEEVGAAAAVTAQVVVVAACSGSGSGRCTGSSIAGSGCHAAFRCCS